MKNRILVAAASLVLAALILLLLPVTPGEPNSTTGPTDPDLITRPHSQPAATTTTPQPTDPGVVRLYSCDDSLLPVLTELAAEYTTLTGVEVVVLCKEEDGCQATLQRYMESEDPPTVLCVHSQQQLKQWQYSLLDLENTALAEALCNESLGMHLDGKLLAIPIDVEAYGLLVNAELLGTKGALSRNDISDLSSLSTAVQILKNNSVKAFPPTSPTLQDAWYLLSDDLQEARTFIDLYIANSSTSGDPMTLFLNGKVAFLAGGSWEYDTLESFTDAEFHVRNLDIIPTYAAGAMQYVCSSAWCVNANARQEDIDATLDFLNWMVTAGEKTPAPVDRLQTLAPFADATWYDNQLERKLRGYMLTESAVLQWKDTEMLANRLMLALTVYLEDRSDEHWESLCQTVEMVKAEYGYE